jgi:hypothetical protein
LSFEAFHNDRRSFCMHSGIPLFPGSQCIGNMSTRVVAEFRKCFLSPRIRQQSLLHL